MMTVNLDVTTESLLERLASRRRQSRSEVIRDALRRLAEEETEPKSAWDQLQGFAGIVDSGGRQLSTATGRQFAELLEQKKRARCSD
jgi:Arc/MetJ-type ribon-helix-helix transcriptional regulator